MSTARVTITFDYGAYDITDEDDARQFHADQLDAGFGSFAPTVYEVPTDLLAEQREAEQRYRQVTRALIDASALVEQGEWTEASVDQRAKRAFSYIVGSFEDPLDNMIETETDCLDVMERCSLPSDMHFDFEMVKARVYDALEANGYRFDEKSRLTR